LSASTISDYENIINKYSIIREENIKYQLWLLIEQYLQSSTHRNSPVLYNKIITAPNNLIDYSESDKWRNFVSEKTAFQLKEELRSKEQEQGEVSEKSLVSLGKELNAKEKKDRESSLAKAKAEKEALLSKETLTALYNNYLTKDQKNHTTPMKNLVQHIIMKNGNIPKELHLYKV